MRAGETNDDEGSSLGDKGAASLMMGERTETGLVQRSEVVAVQRVECKRVIGRGSGGVEVDKTKVSLPPTTPYINSLALLAYRMPLIALPMQLLDLPPEILREVAGASWSTPTATRQPNPALLFHRATPHRTWSTRACTAAHDMSHTLQGRQLTAVPQRRAGR